MVVSTARCRTVPVMVRLRLCHAPSLRSTCQAVKEISGDSAPAPASRASARPCSAHRRFSPVGRSRSSHCTGVGRESVEGTCDAECEVADRAEFVEEEEAGPAPGAELQSQLQVVGALHCTHTGSQHRSRWPSDRIWIYHTRDSCMVSGSSCQLC